VLALLLTKLPMEPRS